MNTHCTGDMVGMTAALAGVRNFGSAELRDWEWSRPGHQLSQEWADVISHPDPEQRMCQLLAAMAIDLVKRLRVCDPKRLAIYFAKRSSPINLGDKESAVNRDHQMAKRPRA
jgi:hypothetical protein